LTTDDDKLDATNCQSIFCSILATLFTHSKPLKSLCFTVLTFVFAKARNSEKYIINMSMCCHYIIAKICKEIKCLLKIEQNRYPEPFVNDIQLKIRTISVETFTHLPKNFIR
jgi:hypothetical protein